MDPQPLSPVLLPTGVTAAVVRQLDRQLLECVEDEALSAAQQAELLAWAHGHLLVAYVATHLGDHSIFGVGLTETRLVTPCLDAVDIIKNMLQGDVPVEDDLTFCCPPVCCPCADAMRERLSVWMRQRVRFAAQRTRWHTDAELDRLWEAVEAHLLTGSIVWFELAEWLETDAPSAETLGAATEGCLEAMCTGRGLAWTPAGAVSG